MPKDIFATRTPSFRAKLNKIQGLDSDEKALLQRIGALLDTFTIAQKQTSNPRQRRRKVETSVPRPQNVTISVITGGIQVSWSKVDVSELDFYEVQVDEDSAFGNPETFPVIQDRISLRTNPITGSIFARVRTVLKNGDVSLYTSTISAVVLDSSIFSCDQDHIEPDNTTTVSPKPTLLGAAFSSEGDNQAFIGTGAYIGPSPLLFSDDDQLLSNTNIRHEVTLNLHESENPYPGIERLAPTIGEYIDADAFYTYSPSFYARFACLPGTFTDFFENVEIDSDPSQVDIEFLRYRIINNFYFPNFNQSGIVMNATLSNIRF